MTTARRLAHGSCEPVQPPKPADAAVSEVDLHDNPSIGVLQPITGYPAIETLNRPQVTARLPSARIDICHRCSATRTVDNRIFGTTRKNRTRLGNALTHCRLRRDVGHGPAGGPDRHRNTTTAKVVDSDAAAGLCSRGDTDEFRKVEPSALICD